MDPFQKRSVYDPRDWYWVVGGDESRAWSSAKSAWSIEYPDDRMTRIVNEVELYDVLARRGLEDRAPNRRFSIAEVRDALIRIDAAATGDANTEVDLRAVAKQIDFLLPPDIGD